MYNDYSSNNTSVSISLPSIGEGLNIEETQLQWLGCLFPMFGRLADLYGRKLVFMTGSPSLPLPVALPKNEIVLDVLRGIQGIGIAAALPASMGILTHTFPAEKIRSIAFSTFAAGAPLGASTGMALGATLTQLSNDGEVAPNKWATSYIIALLVVGVIILSLFLLWQWYFERVQRNPNARYSAFTPPPIMKLSLWARRNGKFGAIMVTVMFTYCSFLGWNFWTQLYYQNYQRYTPVGTMIRLFPMFVTGVIGNFIIAIIIARVSVVWILASGTFITACAAIFAEIDPEATYWAYGFPSAIFSVFGADFVFAAGMIFVARIVEPHEQNLSGALFQTMYQTGTALGVTVSTIVFNRVVAQDSLNMGVIVDEANGDALREALLNGYKAAEWTAFTFGAIGIVELMCHIGALLAILFFWNVGIVGDKGTLEEAKPISTAQSTSTAAVARDVGKAMQEIPRLVTSSTPSENVHQ
ncbi:MFS general substrate transporter [Guyanagaster necrorhizus]|uniref:MFS general substrate transporter n=1 Tax=Guyanagaster necrorhizus TaxID=856835 RepID=A0A9P7VVS0_9AGAR|nr:MFS general substrate transporter [Guyanagaster necrorhizus MCA 3950]KAG7447360.1 MFS general substrate transporter [Guyanagaster necrorhizus MCA 3950]